VTILQRCAPNDGGCGQSAVPLAVPWGELDVGEALKNHGPAWAKSLVPQSVKDRILGTTRIDPAVLTSMGYLRSLMGRYQMKDLVNVEPAAFRARIEQFLALEDAAMEGYKIRRSRETSRSSSTGQTTTISATASMCRASSGTGTSASCRFSSTGFPS
jgi:hypothetical protein